MSDIRRMTKDAVAFRDRRDWKQFHNPKDDALSLVLEATEVMEHFQWKNGKELEKYCITHKTEIAEELSDVLHWVLVMSEEMDIDIVKEFDKKMRKNEKKYPAHLVRGKNKKWTQYSKEERKK
jgi:NTP pyrophosphatase (non-canonical NTP hydrolase)